VARLTALVAGAALLFALSAYAIPPGAKRYISWSDARHGWVPNHADFRCTDAHPEAVWGGTVCATENRGRTWRTIFRGGNYVMVALRTSTRAGVVSTGAHGHTQFWTRDNGRHWFASEVIAGDRTLGAPPPLIVGRANHLYWAALGATTVYRVTPWPPTGEATCKNGIWAWSAFTSDTADPRGNHCQGPPVEAGMRSHPAAVVADAGVTHLSRVPTGFLAVFARQGAAAAIGLTVVVHRGGATSSNVLRAPVREGIAFYSVQRLTVDWPRLTLRVRGLRSGEDLDPRSLLFRSSDGGRTWSRR
jgi:hypothetical protein